MNTKLNSSAPDWRTPTIIITASCLIALTGYGVRASFGLFLDPMTISKGWDRETFALALALQNLLWGIGVPIASAISDKFGASRVMVAGAIMYALGIMGMAEANTGFMLHMTAGLLTGLGVAFTSFSIALAAIANAVGPERRTMALGLGTAAGSMGQVLFSPLAQSFISTHGWNSTLWILAFSTLVIIPLALCLPGYKPSAAEKKQQEQSLSAALKEAIAHRGYLLLSLGFFVCGFHVAFISVHFPAYIKDLGLDPIVGAYALSIIGLFNILGSFIAGIVGQKWSKKYSLSVIYFARAILITILLMLPKTALTIYLFSATMGLLWLATVPLTSGIVVQMFGVRYMATLFGLVFFSHQLGSFIGVWLGGYLYDTNGSYDPIWWAGIVLGVLAAVIHIPIDEKPMDRLADLPA